jgi:hypothetical protein
MRIKGKKSAKYGTSIKRRRKKKAAMRANRIAVRRAAGLPDKEPPQWQPQRSRSDWL